MDTKREHRTHAEGSPRGKPCDLTYSPSGRLIGKSRSNSSVTLSASADMAYGYCDDYQPHAVKRMFDYKSGTLYDMRWDKAGNLGQVSIAKPGGMFQAGRFLYWTEDNRMHAAVDDRYTSYYAYDHSGERRLKLTGKNDLLDVNADFMATYTILNEPTLYPSAYMVLTNKGYTNVAKAESRASLLALPRRSSVTVRKHYYAGTERVAARLGGGGLDAIGHAIGNNDTLLEKADLLYKQSLDQVNNRVLNKNDLDCIMNSKFAKEEFGHPIDDVPSRMQAGVELNHDQFKDMVNSMLDDINHGQENEVYFYHSDHLGSASWITDFGGVAVQHIQYLPYGEPYINQHPFGYSERFTFTGKERDEETGYGYFGARYMDHELMTMWLSVDPLSDKYPNISPYAYCAWNPVKLVDPDGRDVYIIGDEKSKAEALRQIQQKSKNMTFSIDKNGKLSFEGEAKTKRERYMANIINSENVHVNLKVQNHSNHNGQTIDIGGFDGNALSEDGKSITTFQVINVAKSGNQDIECDNLGNMIWHEISESYEGGLISLTNQKNAPPAIKGNDKTVYRKAHYAAGRFFPGTTNEGTVRDYIESLPREIQNLIPEGYKVLNGNKQKSWYSR